MQTIAAKEKFGFDFTPQTISSDYFSERWVLTGHSIEGFNTLHRPQLFEESHMSLFNRSGGDPVASRLESAPADSGLSVIGTGMRITGDIETTGVIKIDGTVEGSIRSAKQVLLGCTGAIHGDVHTDEAVLGGTVVGAVVAAQRVEVQSTCSIQGDVQTKSIIVLEGGVINGAVRMEAATAARLNPAAARAALALSQ